MFELAIFFIVIAMIVGFYAQSRVSSAFKEYSQVRASSNLTGAQVAEEILKAAQIEDVQVVEINGMLGDHYDPSSKQLRLSSETFNTPSVAAAGIAAHETGHAIQHAKAYAPLELRMTIVPVTQIVSQFLPFIMFGGIFLRLMPWSLAIQLGAICYGVLTVFQLITLPV